MRYLKRVAGMRTVPVPTPYTRHRRGAHVFRIYNCIHVLHECSRKNATLRCCTSIDTCNSETHVALLYMRHYCRYIYMHNIYAQC